MKNWKHYEIIGFSIIFVLAVIFIACENDKRKCNCVEKTHLDEGESCNCGGEDCDCTLKINVILNAGVITVWKEVGVSLDDFNKIVNELNLTVSSYALGTGQISNFKNNFPVIYIVKGTGISHKVGSLTIGCKENVDTIYDYLVNDNSLI